MSVPKLKEVLQDFPLTHGVGISILNPLKVHYCLWNAWCEHLKPNACGQKESDKTFCFFKLVLDNLHYLEWYMVQHLKVFERYLAHGIQHSPMWKQRYAHNSSWCSKIQRWICKSTRKTYWELCIVLVL